ncbi:cytochrome c'' precursor [mine drainage metagenome]|uniref:Cytochrome c n=1 Tax=mine drainage metagenome TaxID=410659 RepID=A0A1J5PW72_9ZZZZ
MVVPALYSEIQFMKQTLRKMTWLACLVLPLSAVANPILDSYRAAARQENPAFKDFSAIAGRKLYTARRGDLMCASCHTDSPMLQGKNVNTNKVILPMAPSVNPKRLTDAAKVEQWFKSNCNNVFKRDCSAEEKGNFMAYLLSK